MSKKINEPAVDGHSNSPPGPSQSTTIRTRTSAKVERLLEISRQFFRRHSPFRRGRKKNPEYISTSDDKDSKPISDLQDPHDHGQDKDQDQSQDQGQGQGQAECQVQVHDQVADSEPVDVVVNKEGEMTDPIGHDHPELELECSIGQAEQDASTIKSITGGASIAASTGAQGNNILQSVDSFDSTYLRPFKIFNTVVTALTDVHPYAKIALAGLSWASQIIMNQIHMDAEIQKLISKIRDIYELLISGGELEKISGMQDVLVPISKQILDCAQFIKSYSEKRGFWTRLGRDMISGADGIIQNYNDALDALVQKFRDRTTRDGLVTVHGVLVTAEETRVTVYRIVEELGRLGQDIQLDGMLYAIGAGINTTKSCLEGTRLEILGEIADWVNDEGAERIFWLSGVAGSGKSAICHAIGRWLRDIGRLGSFFCFDINEGDQRHKKFFSTIARDLADCNVDLRHIIAEAVSRNASLKTTIDILQQWEEFVLEPLSKASTIGPIVIVIDALDESGPESSREHILHVLADEATNLPSNVRILLTSRPLPDINEALRGKAHVRAKTMDSIDPATTERDIVRYVSYRLRSLHDRFTQADYTTLALQADGLFEWARLACEFIRSRARGGYNPMDRFKLLVDSSDRKGRSLLDNIYTTILSKAIYDSAEAQARFQSIMRQILGTLEPLPMMSLDAMRQMFPKNEDRFEVEIVLESMAPLLSGITDPSIPVRPLHASFHDFLTDELRSGEFFVDVREKETHRDLAFASLGVMKRELRFNMCHLETSYLRNTDIPDLSQRVKDNISPHLSYSSRYWSVHVHNATFDARLGEEICSFIGKEYLVYWFEALSLLGGINEARGALESGMSPIEGNEVYSDTLAIARDAQRFIQVFGGPISQSTPHLYLSALPFSPKNSVFASSVASRLTQIPRVILGQDEDWPSIQLLLRGHGDLVASVALSPNGKWIASGSMDKTI